MGISKSPSPKQHGVQKNVVNAKKMKMKSFMNSENEKWLLSGNIEAHIPDNK